jgi:hypothetical protein
MSEKIFACLMRLYPSRFREKYTEEAMQLYRDLSRHETGLLRGMGLWFRLLADLAFGLPQACRNTYVSTTASPAALAVQGVPTFRVLEQKPLRPGLLLCGSILTVRWLSAFSAVLHYSVANRSWGGSNVPSSPIAAVIERLNRSMSSGQDGGEYPQTDGSLPDNGQHEATREANPVTTHPVGVETQKAFGPAISPKERRQIIPPTVEKPDLRHSYSQPSKNVQEAMPQSEKRGVWVIAPEGVVGVPRTTPYLQAVTPDANANAHDKIPIPSRNGSLGAAVSPHRVTTEQEDCTFATIEELPHNIGCVRVPDAATAISIAEPALAKVYGKRQVDYEKPLTAKLENGIWKVYGTLCCPDRNERRTCEAGKCDGGVAAIELRQSDGKILSISHTK